MPTVEEIGIQPVPRALRTGTWRDLFAITFAFGINPLYFVLGAISVAEFGLPLWWAVGLSVVAQAVSFTVLTIVAQAGSDYGIPGQVSMRAFLGTWGARGLSSAYRTVAALYWFATQGITAAAALRALFDGLAGIHLPIVPVSIGLTAAQALLAVAGFDVLRWTTRVVLPVGLAFTGIAIGLYLSSDDPRYDPARALGGGGDAQLALTWAGAAGYLTLMIGSQLTFLPSAADFTRYTRSRRDTRIGMGAGATAAMVVTTFTGGYAAAATGSSKGTFEVVAALTGQKAVLAFVVLALVVGSLAVNTGNAYNIGMSVANALPALGRVRATALGACAGVALAAVPSFLTSAADWITRLGNVATPLAAVVLLDYLVLHRQRLDIEALYDPRGRYAYLGGVNVAAVLATAAGVVAYSLVGDAWLKAAWGAGAAAAAYVLLVPVQRRRLAARGSA